MMLLNQILKILYAKKLAIFKVLIFMGVCFILFYLMNYSNHEWSSNATSDNNEYQSLSNTKVKPKTLVQKSKWIVVTSINMPTEQIKQLADIKDFQLLVIGDKKTKQTWSHKNAIFLSLEQQKAHGFNVIKNTPFGSYTRKNIGNTIIF